MMDRIHAKSVPVARSLVAALPDLIAQAEAGNHVVTVCLLRLALEDVRKLVDGVDTRCGRIVPASDASPLEAR